jgi:hypothetical protein
MGLIGNTGGSAKDGFTAPAQLATHRLVRDAQGVGASVGIASRTAIGGQIGNFFHRL